MSAEPIGLKHVGKRVLLSEVMVDNLAAESYTEPTEAVVPTASPGGCWVKILTPGKGQWYQVVGTVKHDQKQIMVLDVLGDLPNLPEVSNG